MHIMAEEMVVYFWIMFVVLDQRVHYFSAVVTPLDLITVAIMKMWVCLVQFHISVSI